jgi:hypothetical protein
VRGRAGQVERLLGAVAPVIVRLVIGGSETRRAAPRVVARRGIDGWGRVRREHVMHIGVVTSLHFGLRDRDQRP